jgi:excisionase family DNA binding protein
MNPAVLALYERYLDKTGDKAAAASLALADVLLTGRQPTEAAADAGRSLSVQEAAKRLHVAPNTVYHLCQKGQLAHHRVGKAVRILPADIDAYQKTAAEAARPRPLGRHGKFRL